MIDPIADMLSRIRNAQASRHKDVAIPASKLRLAIARVLEHEGYVVGVEKRDNEVTKHPEIIVELKYERISHARRTGKILGLQQISKQGQRKYVRNTEIHEIKNGYGVSIVSTSQGVMTGKNARRKGLGGEMICIAW